MNSTLPKIRKPVRDKFERVLAKPHVFDYYGMERSGHFAVLRWLHSALPGPRMHVPRADTRDLDPLWYHPSGWYTTAIELPETMSLSYGPDADINMPTTRISNARVITCVRDIRNMVASRLKKNADVHPIFRVDTWLTTLWQAHARQALGLVDHFIGRCVPIVFDRWFNSRQYRDEMLELLGERFGWEVDIRADDTKRVPNLAGGSSFDALAFDGKAYDMPVCDRWQAYEDHPVYRALLTPEILDLNARLIGETS